MLLGDFNCVLKDNEKINGCAVNFYEIKDFLECYLLASLLDMTSSGCFFTWTNNSVCSKLDRVLINNCWRIQGFEGQVTFLPRGCLSDHSPTVVSLFQQRSIPWSSLSSLICGPSTISFYQQFVSAGKANFMGQANLLFA